MFNREDFCLEIDRLKPDDVPAVAELERLCFSQPWSQKAIEDELKNTLAVMFAAKIDGAVAGYAGMHDICGEGYITNVAVHPDYRRAGIGAALVQALVDYATYSNMHFLTLEVRASNEAAIALYKSFGFAEQGVRRGFYQKPVEDGLIMTKFFESSVYRISGISGLR